MPYHQLKTVITDPEDINERFREYYAKLYTTQGEINTSEMEAFFTDLNLHTIEGHEASVIEVPVSRDGLAIGQCRQMPQWPPAEVAAPLCK